MDDELDDVAVGGTTGQVGSDEAAAVDVYADGGGAHSRGVRRVPQLADPVSGETDTRNMHRDRVRTSHVGAVIVTFQGVLVNERIVRYVGSRVREHRETPGSWLHVTVSFDPQARHCLARLSMQTVCGKRVVMACGDDAELAVRRAFALSELQALEC